MNKAFRWVFIILGVLSVLIDSVMFYNNMSTKPGTALLGSVNYLMLAGLYFMTED